jgi:type II secretory pathway component PulM
MEFKLTAVTDFLNEQSWFQELKQKWEELDPQSRSYLKIAGSATFALLLIYFTLASMWSVHNLKKESTEKSDLLSLIQNANEELKRLRESGPPATADATGKWDVLFDQISAASGIDKSTMTVSAEKPGANSEVAKEALFDISLKKVTIRQVVKLAFGLESASRPVKVRNLSIDTNADPAGYVDAQLAVSAFSLIAEKK